MNCPNCKRKIESKNVNIEKDIGICENCHTVFNISSQLKSKVNVYDSETNFNLNKAPNYTWYKKERNKVVIGASTASYYAFFLVPFLLVWSGFSLSGIYGSQILNNEFSLSESIFGLPFLIGTIVFGTFALMTVFGKVEIILDKTGGKVFTGIGIVGYVKKFKWEEIIEIKEDISKVNYPGNQGKRISIEGQKRISFGEMLKEERRFYILKSLKKIHYNIRENNTLT